MRFAEIKARTMPLLSSAMRSASLLNIVAFKMVFQYFFQLLRLAVIQMRKHLPDDIVYQFIFHNPISAVFMGEHG